MLIEYCGFADKMSEVKKKKKKDKRKKQDMIVTTFADGEYK